MQRKRVDIVNVKLCRESSFLYDHRTITSPEKCYGILKKVFEDKDREEFIAIALNTKNNPIAVNTCSIGTLNATLVHPREVFKFAILANAASIIIAHNHPSGDFTPSEEDEVITTRLVESGKLIGISVVDHIIYTDFSYYSFKEHDKMNLV